MTPGAPCIRIIFGTGLVDPAFERQLRHSAGTMIWRLVLVLIPSTLTCPCLPSYFHLNWTCRPVPAAFENDQFLNLQRTRLPGPPPLFRVFTGTGLLSAHWMRAALNGSCTVGLLDNVPSVRLGADSAYNTILDPRSLFLGNLFKFGLKTTCCLQTNFGETSSTKELWSKYNVGDTTAVRRAILDRKDRKKTTVLEDVEMSTYAVFFILLG
ncbi:hypothetical protein K438DRAFT_1766316 [Mycena galopus ATCC 62051]|nr:hypothetical protein K438DRAFT_1766316 [Mycena galopus ATCC 62051]